MKTTIKFGGFYNSIHSDIIDNQIESYMESENQDRDREFKPENKNENHLSEDDYNFDYQAIQLDYAKQYSGILSNFIDSEYNLKIAFNDISIWSPKYYNYNTHEIETNISDIDNNNLIKHFINDVKFLDYLKDDTKSYDGYSSHYTFDQALSNKDNILPLYILEYLCNEFQCSNAFSEVYDMYIDIIVNQPELVA